MKFPIKGKDIIELGMEEYEINSAYLTFQTFFEEEFESIEYFSKDYNNGLDFLSKKKFYHSSGFIDRIEFYLSSGKMYKVINFEKTDLQIKSKSPVDYSFTEEIWDFNQHGNLVSIRGEYGNNYFFEYDEVENLKSVSEGFQFQWKNKELWRLTNQSDNTLIQKVINKKGLETTIESVDKNNKTEVINTYNYDELGRLIRVISGLNITEIKYQNKENTKIKTSTNYLDGMQTSTSTVIEKSITNNKIEITSHFQASKDGPVSKSIIVKNRCSK